MTELHSMPYSEDAEKGALSCLLQAPNLMGQCAELIVDEHFYHPSHRLIYAELRELSAKMRPIDLVSVSSHLTNKGLIDKVGGPAFIAELYTLVPTTAHFRHYIGIMHDKWLLRRIITSCTEGVQMAYEYQEDVPALIGMVEQKVLDIRPKENRGQSELLSDLLDLSMDRIEEAIKRGGGLRGYDTGFPWLNKMTSGFQRDEIWFIGARPGGGKTSLLLNLLEKQLADFNRRVGIFSLEMKHTLLNERLISQRSGVELELVRTGSLNKKQMHDVTNAISKLQNSARCFVDDRAGLTLDQVRHKARRWVKEEGVEVIFGDFLQRMGFDRRDKRNLNSADEHGYNSRGMADLQKELGVPFVWLAQLNRKCEEGNGRNPRPSDFDRCGQIEQDADMILLMSPEPIKEGQPEQRHRRIVWDICKNKNGPVMRRTHLFDSELTSFNPYPPKEEEEQDGRKR